MRTSIFIATCLAVLAAAVPQDPDPETTTSSTSTSTSTSTISSSTDTLTSTSSTDTTTQTSTSTSTSTSTTSTSLPTYTPEEPIKGGYCKLVARNPKGYHCNVPGSLTNPATIGYGVTTTSFSSNALYNCYLSCNETDKCLTFALDATAGTCVLYSKPIPSMGYKAKKSSKTVISNVACYGVTCAR